MTLNTNVKISDFISGWQKSYFGHFTNTPWEATRKAEAIIAEAIGSLKSEYKVHGDIAIHVSAVVEQGAVLKGPIILEANAFVAANAYLRGGVFLDQGCIVGPNCELKTTFMFAGSKVAHLSFVGDSIIGAGANIEAGAIVANYRNELVDKSILIVRQGSTIATGVEKFGALIGDEVRIGANAVIAPGALLDRLTVVRRLGLVDQHPTAMR